MNASGAPTELERGTASIRVGIVDHIRLYREGLAQILGREPGIDVVGMAGNADGDCADLRDLRPDIVLFHMPLPENLNALRAVVQLTPEARIVALGISETEDEVLACVEAGAAGYLSREGSYEDLVCTIKTVAQGETRCSPRMTATLLRRVASLAAEQHARRITVRLTVREWEIIKLVDQSLSNKEIAQRLSIDVRTVKNHVHNILEKVNVHRRGEAAALMREAMAIRR